MTVSLPENPTTGYVWHFVKIAGVNRNGTPICSILSDVFLPGSGTKTSRLGGPGLHQWHFLADAPGTATIALQLIREWDPNSPKRSFALHLHVI